MGKESRWDEAEDTAKVFCGLMDYMLREQTHPSVHRQQTHPSVHMSAKETGHALHLPHAPSTLPPPPQIKKERRKEGFVFPFSLSTATLQQSFTLSRVGGG